MQNLYVSLAGFRRRFVNDATLDAQDAAEIEGVIEAASRRVDEATHRHYFDLTDARVFDTEGECELMIPDLIAATSVKLDEDGDRAFEVTLNPLTDYYLVRFGAGDQDASPKTMIRLDAENGQRSAFPWMRRGLEITGRWGYGDAKERLAGATATLADGTTENMTVTGAPALSVGDTLLLENEQVYVRAGSASPYTVTRAVNGTTGAAHAAVPIDRYVYVPEVREATMILAGRMWKRRDTSYANVIANPVVGTFETFRQTDPDVAALLAPHVRADRLAVA